MSRSPWIDLFSRMVSVHRKARQLGTSAKEIYEKEKEKRGLSRRGFLQGALMLGAAPALSGCELLEYAPPHNLCKVAIIGGGMAGLHCAYRLRQLGLRATVFEASGRLGGRIFSDRRTFSPELHCELGGELIDTGHETMRDLAQELGIELLDYRQDDPSLDTLLADIGGRRLSASEILEGFTPIAAQIDAALSTLTDQEDLFVYYNRPNGGQALDRLSISAWFDLIGASGPVRKLLEVAYTTEFGLEADVSDVLNMLFLISSRTDEFELYGESDERFHCKDGNDTYIQRLAERLAPEQIETHAELESVREMSDGRYGLTFRRGHGHLAYRADHVVLAIPFSILRMLELDLDLPPAKAQAIRELGYGSNSKLMCGFDSKIWREKYQSNGETFSDRAFQSTWETSRLQWGLGGILTNFTGGIAGFAQGAGSAQQQASKFLEAIEPVFPGIGATSNGKVARFHWPTYRLTLGSYAAYQVGQYTQFAGAERERFGNVHFAGEHTSLDAQGYMEGAALTGAIAAQEVGLDLGLLPSVRKGSAAERIWQRAELTRKLGRWHAGVRRWKKAG